MSTLGAVTFRGRDSFFPDPGGRGDFSGRVLDESEFSIREPEVDRVGSSIAGGGSPAGSLVDHADDYTVKQKILESSELPLYDKYMEIDVEDEASMSDYERGYRDGLRDGQIIAQPTPEGKIAAIEALRADAMSGNITDPGDEFYSGCTDDCEDNCGADHRGEQ